MAFWSIDELNGQLCLDELAPVENTGPDGEGGDALFAVTTTDEPVGGALFGFEVA